jgi:hypothetical protein
MDHNITAVLLSCGVYALYVLLPLIPSVIIYKMFPDTRTTAEGSVSNWKIKAGGAFAAYVTVVLLGYAIIARTESLIGGISACTWTIRGQVVLKDGNDNTVSGRTLLKTLQVSLVPDIVNKTNQYVEMHIPSQSTVLPNSIINLSIPLFGEETIDLNRSQYPVRTNFYDKTIEFTKPIVIRQFEEESPRVSSLNTTATTSRVYQQPLRNTGPPAEPAATP